MKLHKTHIERELKYHDLEHDIFDEDFKKETTLFGLFTISRTFKLRNDMTKTSPSRTVVNGLKNK